MANDTKNKVVLRGPLRAVDEFLGVTSGWR